MKLLLHADIPKLGHFGDVVEVKSGYARNYLLPQKLAVQPTEANVKAIQEERAQRSEQRRLALEELKKAAAKVEGTEIGLSARANERGHLFGSVGQEDIAAALREKGFEVQAKHVVMSEHFRMLGNYEVKLHYGEDIEASVKIEIVRPEEQAGDGQPEQSESTSSDG